MTESQRKGFTLIELLIVVVIIGLIASIAIPKFSSTKAKTYAAAVKSDLRTLTRLQEQYFQEFETYTTSAAALGVQNSKGVVLNILEGDAKGWSAHATHTAANPLECAVFYGDAAPVAPATKEGILTCN